MSSLLNYLLLLIKKGLGYVFESKDD